MKVEVGKVYKCGDTFVHIDYESGKLNGWGIFHYIGVSCLEDGGHAGNTVLGRFNWEGLASNCNVKELRHNLQSPLKRETITIGSSIYYKDEFEEATKHLKEVK